MTTPKKTATKTKNKPKRFRSPNRIKSTDALQQIYHFYIKPFLAGFALHEGQKTFEEGIEAFFNVDDRPILWCRAKVGFKIPGKMWADESSPYKLIEGTGRRYVGLDENFVLRMDKATPDRNEIDFDGQVFVLSRAQLEAIKDKIQPIA